MLVRNEIAAVDSPPVRKPSCHLNRLVNGQEYRQDHANDLVRQDGQAAKSCSPISYVEVQIAHTVA